MDEPFSHIHFPGITKKKKINLRAIKKPGGPPAPPSFLSKFRNPLKKEENPEPKQAILSDNPFKFNPITKQYEFGDEKVEKEEFQPPPTGFSKKETIGAGKKYVDVIGQDINLREYKPGMPEPQIFNENFSKQEEDEIKKEVKEEPLLNQEKSENFESNEVKGEFFELNQEKSPVFELKKLEKSGKKVKKLKALLEIEKMFRERAQNDLALINGYNKETERNGELVGIGEKIVLEQEIVELNTDVLNKIRKNLELNEKLVCLETQIKEYKHQMEAIYEEKNEVIEKCREDALKMEQELSLAKVKSGGFDLEAAARIKELEKVIEQLHLRISFDTKARVKSEINEKKLIFAVKELENDFSFAVKAIKDLNFKNSQLLHENQRLSMDLINSPVDSSNIMELFQVNNENLSLKTQLSDLDSQFSSLKVKESELFQKLKNKSSQILQLEQTNTLLKEKLMKENKKELETELNKLNSRYSIEKSALNAEIKTLNAVISEVRKNFQELKVKENDYEIQIEELENQISALKAENCLLSASESRLIEQEKGLKSSKASLVSENSQLSHNFIKLKATYHETCAELDKLKQQFEFISTKNKNLVLENDKKVLELSKKHQTQETKLKNQIQDAEDSLKILDGQLKSADSKVVDLTEALHTAEVTHHKDLSTIRSQLSQETEEKNTLNEELKITKDSLNAEIESLIRKLEQQKFVTGQLEQEITENCGIREENKKIKVELNGAQTKIKELEEEIVEKSDGLRELNEKLEDFESEKVSLTNLLTESSGETMFLQEKIKEFEVENKELVEKQKVLESELKSVENSSSDIQAKAESIIKQLESNCENLKIELEKAKNEIMTERNKVELIGKCSEEVEYKLKELKESVETLKQSLETEVNKNLSLNEELSISKSLIDVLKQEKNEAVVYYEEEFTKSETTKNELSEENIRMYEEISKLEVDLRLANQTIEETKAKDNTELLQIEILEKNREISELIKKTSNQDLLRTISSLENQIKSLNKSLEAEVSLRKSLESDLNSIQTSNNSFKTQIQSLSQESSSLKHKIQSLEIEKTNLESQITTLELSKSESIPEPTQTSTISDLFTNTPGHFFLPEVDSNLISSLQSQKFDLESQLQTLEDEKNSLQSQLSDLSSENDALYEKNLNLVSQNQFLQNELKKSSENRALQDLTQKLKDKEDELQLVKNSFHELLQKSSENSQSSRPSASPTGQEGWLTSVLGTIFLTDKERGY